MELIEDILDELHALIGDRTEQARPFLFVAAKSYPELGRALLARAAETPEGRLAGLASTLLFAILDPLGGTTIELASTLLATGCPQLAREVAVVFGVQRGQREEIFPGEKDLLGALITHEDQRVHQLAFGAVHSLARIDPEFTAELLTSIPPSDARFAWEEFAAFVGPRGTMSWPMLPEVFRDQVFQALRQLPTLEGYALGELLILLSHDAPRLVLDLLLSRAKALNNETASSGFSALRDSSVGPYRFRELPEFQGYLREIKDWFISAPPSSWRSHIGPQLFSAVAGPLDSRVLEVIEECFVEPTSATMNAAALMLRNAPKELLGNLEFVSRCLHAAQETGPESLSNVQGALRGAVFTGNRFGANWTHVTETGEQKSMARELADRCPPGSTEERFYRSIVEAADAWNTYLSADDNPPPDDRPW